MRHEAPQFIKDYRAWVKAGAPACCHTCDFYESTGRCAVFDMEPPEAFAASIDECKSYVQEVPF